MLTVAGVVRAGRLEREDRAEGFGAMTPGDNMATGSMLVTGLSCFGSGFFGRPTNGFNILPLFGTSNEGREAGNISNPVWLH